VRKDKKSNNSPTASPKASSSKRSSITLALVALAQFMVIVDFTIVQVALPSIGREFGVSINGLQWIVTAYGLTLAGFLLLSGRSGDIYGHKKLFITGIMLFSIASLAGGLASSEFVLILARIVQGLGAAMASATGLSIIATVFPEGKERNRAISIFAAVSGSGFVAGMTLGGIITATLGWRWVFEINVPIGLIVSLLSAKYISNATGNTIGQNHKKKRQLDIYGAVTVTAGLMLLVYSLNIAQDSGFGSPQTLGLLLSSALVLSIFFLIEHRSKEPLMPLGFMRRGIVFWSNALAMLQLAAFVAMTFILTNYFQQALGYSALSTGLALAPMGVVFLITSAFLAAPLVNRFGVRPSLILSMVLQTVGYLLLSRISITESYVGGLLGPMLLIGFGAAFSFTPTNIAALMGARRGEEGLASGLINTSRQIGGPIGIVVLLTVATFGTTHTTGQITPPSIVDMVTGFGYAFLAAALLTGIGIVFAFSLKQEKQQHQDNSGNTALHQG
jgi:EmrB/QacA subfamily drug resistance transporter